MRELEIRTQTAYAELLEILQIAEESQSAAESADMLKRLAAEVQKEVDLPMDGDQIRVIQNLADSGVFRGGGILVGSLAFQLMSLTLGIIWAEASDMTSDIDLAVDPRVFFATATTTDDVDIAVERKVWAAPLVKTDIPANLDSLDMGFFPRPGLSHKHPPTQYAIRGSQLRLDILTPRTNDSGAPVPIPRFGCAAEPLPFLSYLMQDPVPVVLLAEAPVLVSIPQPVRYALHKLIVSQERVITSQIKARKDIFQAHQILTYLKERRPGDIAPAWAELVVKGPKWRRQATAGLKAAEKAFGRLGLDLE